MNKLILRNVLYTPVLYCPVFSFIPYSDIFKSFYYLREKKNTHFKRTFSHTNKELHKFSRKKEILVDI